MRWQPVLLICALQQYAAPVTDLDICLKNQDWFYFMCGADASNPCIHRGWVCDGVEDCDDGSDETICKGCPGWFQCKFGYPCLQKESVCDGTKDCPDGSDESVSTCGVCPQGEFLCDFQQCISNSSVCDGVLDCFDNSDELQPQCLQQIALLWCNTKTEFNCFDPPLSPVLCIPKSWVCDGEEDCVSGIDEGAVCATGGNKCSSDDACPGSQKCDLPTHTCVCPHGFRITGTGCEDVNECQQYGHCSQYCTNTEGSFSCSCADEYTLNSDKVTCRANDGNAHLIYVHGQDVRMMNILTGTYTDLAKNRLTILSVDYNFKEGMVYFVEYDSQQIVKVPADKSHEPVTILNALSGAREPEGLAIDWINDWIYWSNHHFRTISMAKLDGSYQYHRVVVNESLTLDIPRGVAVDPLKGYLFWTAWGAHSHIGRAAMDGSDQQHIIVNDVVWPNGIAVDTIAQYVYWVDVKLGTVVVADYYGHNKKVLVQGGIGRPLFIALFEDNMYVSSQWGSRKTGRVFVASRMNGSHVTTLEEDVHLIQGVAPAVAVYQSRQQRPGPNPCNGTLCSDQCVASYASCTGYKCICQDGRQLLNDELTCENKITRCSDSYCNNNGQCVIKDGSKSCLCGSLHQGSKCETVISGVLGCPRSCCHHHGLCHLSIKGPFCVCSVGYAGVRCEEEIYNVPSAH